MQSLCCWTIGLAFGLSAFGCSSDENSAGGPREDASTTGGTSSIGGSGGTSSSGGRANGGSGGLSAGGAAGTGGRADPDAGSGDASADAGADAGSTRTFTWDFTSDKEGWTGGFADYPAGEETFYELAFDHSALPTEVGPGGGLRIRGNNHSDDLFMFVAREITGLRPSTPYAVSIEARIATNAPSDCSGIGGAPGGSVFFKMGAVRSAPRSAPAGDGSQFMTMNLDTGYQGSGGADMAVTGDIGNTKLCPDDTYELKTLALTGFSVSTDAAGRVWIVLGTDSGFEGTTTLYYDRVSLTLRLE